MRKQKNIFKLIFIFGFLFFSCTEKKSETRINKYFDLKNYFSKEAARLREKKIKLKKIVLKDEINEEKIFEIIDWKQELKPFSECDINKASWANSYSKSSSGNEINYCIIYTAKDSSLKIKNIQVCFENNIPLKIEIKRSNDNLYYDYFSKLNYRADEGYKIENIQKITLTQQSKIIIEGKFLK